MKKTIHCAFMLLCLSYTSIHAQDLNNIAKQQPVSLHGTLDLRGVFYSVNGIPARRNPISYIISGSPVLSIYGLQLPFSFTFSEQERSFSQPFNQFGVSPTYKWITLHGGYRNVTFSPYTLDGYTMLGGGAELNPGKWRIGFMYGRLNRATTIDTASGAIQPFSFSRKGMAMRLGYGTEKSFIDFSFLKAKDDSNSVKVSKAEAQKVLPAENAVLATAARIAITKRFFIQGDAAVSLYTDDMGSPLSLSENTDVFKSILKLNGTSAYYLAYTAATGYQADNFSIRAEYRHIDPGFQSMGAYFFNNDLESYSLAGSFAAFKNKLHVNASIGLQNDNLRAQKEATSRRVIGSANISWQASNRLGIDASYTNFSTNAKPVVVQVQQKYLLAQTNHNLSVNPRYIIASEKQTQVIMLSYNYTGLVDANTASKAVNNFTTQMILANYSITLNPQYLTISAGVNKIVNNLSIGLINNYGGSLGVQKSFLKNKWQVGSNAAYTLSSMLQSKSRILNAGLQSSYRPVQQHQFSLRLSLIGNYPQETAVANGRFSETTGEIGYSFNF